MENKTHLFLKSMFISTFTRFSQEQNNPLFTQNIALSRIIFHVKLTLFINLGLVSTCPTVLLYLILKSFHQPTLLLTGTCFSSCLAMVLTRPRRFCNPHQSPNSGNHGYRNRQSYGKTTKPSGVNLGWWK